MENLKKANSYNTTYQVISEKKVISLGLLLLGKKKMLNKNIMKFG